MKQRTGVSVLRVAVCTTVVLALSGVAALTQPPPGGRPDGPGGFGPPGGPGRQGPRELTAVNVPIGALESGLKLTASQKEKISQIQAQLQKDRRAAMPNGGRQGRQGGPPPGGGPGGDGPGGPPPGGGPGGPPPGGDFGPPPGGGPGGGPPDFEAMRASMEKMQSLERAANKKIEAQLTSEQKSALPGLLKDLQLLGSVGIPAEVIGDLKLTDDEKKQISDIVKKSRTDMQEKMEEARQSGDFGSIRELMMDSQRQTHEKAMAVLTDDQRGIVEKFIKAHPRPANGGPGGFGPPGGGPGGFGPPPPGGPDGPPPPPGDPNQP